MLAAAGPLLGTGLYLATVQAVGYREVVGESVATHIRPAGGILNILRAPARILVPGLLGLEQPTSRLGDAELLVSGVGLLAAVAWGWRSRHRPLIYGGLSLILGGYLLIYPFRSEGDPRWTLTIQRYHLFPSLGLVFVLAPALASGLRRFDGSGTSALRAATVAGIVPAASHLPALSRNAETYHFPDQGKTLAALDRVSGICREAGITRDQAMAFLPPIRPGWFPQDGPGVPLLVAPTARDARLDRRAAEAVLSSTLDAGEREALFGAMDVSGALRSEAAPGGGPGGATYRLTRVENLRPSADPDTYESTGGSAFAEFRSVATTSGRSPGADLLELPKAQSPGWVELWWAGDGEPWSETRSVKWRLDPASGGGSCRSARCPTGTRPARIG